MLCLYFFLCFTASIYTADHLTYPISTNNPPGSETNQEWEERLAIQEEQAGPSDDFHPLLTVEELNEKMAALKREFSEQQEYQDELADIILNQAQVTETIARIQQKRTLSLKKSITEYHEEFEQRVATETEDNRQRDITIDTLTKEVLSLKQQQAAHKEFIRQAFKKIKASDQKATEAIDSLQQQLQELKKQ